MRNVAFLLAISVGLSLGAGAYAKKSRANVRAPKGAVPEVLLYAGTGTWIYQGASKFSTGFGVGARVTRELPIYVGADFAFNYLDSTPDLGFQILPTATYRWETGKRQIVHPFVGVSAGVHVVPRNALFEMMLRPGAEISLSSLMGLKVEAAFGVTDASFSFQPSVNALFKL